MLSSGNPFRHIEDRTWFELTSSRRDSNPSMKPDRSSANCLPLYSFNKPFPAICQQHSRDRFSLLSGFLCGLLGVGLYAQPIKINTSRPFSTTGSKALKGSIGLRDHNEQSPNITSNSRVHFFVFCPHPPLGRKRKKTNSFNMSQISPHDQRPNMIHPGGSPSSAPVAAWQPRRSLSLNASCGHA